MNGPVNQSRLLRNLEKLLQVHAPSGSETEMDELVRHLLEMVKMEMWQDEIGSIVVRVEGKGEHPPIAVTAHKDEIAMIVKRVDEDGRLRVRPLGGLWPWAIGEGPVEIMGRYSLVPGVLSVGSKHVSSESNAFALKEDEAMSWEKTWIETRLTKSELQQQGVRVGSKAVIARRHKASWSLGDCICGYNLDCRAGVAMLIEAIMLLAEEPPLGDVYLIATAEEEIGAHGATFTLAQLPTQTVIALDVVPVAEEYQTRNNGEPVLGCKDGRSVYDERIVYHMEDLAESLGFETQTVVLTSYGTDATLAKAAGSAGRAALIGYPGENTHGYEICSIKGLVNATRLLMAYLWNPAE